MHTQIQLVILNKTPFLSMVLQDFNLKHKIFNNLIW